MKKNYYLLLLISLFLFNVSIVGAKEYTCVYEGISKGAAPTTIRREFVVKDDKIGILYDKTVVIDSFIDSTMTDKELIEVLDGKCPTNITICTGINKKDPIDMVFAVLINNTLYSKISFPFSFSQENNRFIVYEIPSVESCITGNYDKQNSTGEVENITFPCDVVENHFKEMKKALCKDGSLNCVVDKNLYNREKTKVSSFCDVSLKYLDVSNDCVDACLKVNDEIARLEVKEDDLSQCGLSERLILWIANIIKWVKYIIPVAVIVLSIIDLMKAIGADKEDEMKKAQGRFVKRLIIAALIFIIPFIIEFVLDKMGFDANGCGIIDL